MPSGDDCTQCWADLDRRLMEEVVPWLPCGAENEVDVFGPAVSRYEFDQFTGETAYAHVAVDASKQ